MGVEDTDFVLPYFALSATVQTNFFIKTGNDFFSEHLKSIIPLQRSVNNYKSM